MCVNGASETQKRDPEYCLCHPVCPPPRLAVGTTTVGLAQHAIAHANACSPVAVSVSSPFCLVCLCCVFVSLIILSAALCVSVCLCLPPLPPSSVSPLSLTWCMFMCACALVCVRVCVCMSVQVCTVLPVPAVRRELQGPRGERRGL